MKKVNDYMAKTYENAGVNLEAGYEVVRRIKQHVASTARKGTMGNIGAFGGMFDLSELGIREPVLVSGTDGVGTKLKIAFAMDKHDTVGIDAVAMCVNDVLAQGAEPLVFLDYVAVGHNIPEQVEAIVAGVAEGCRQAGCALVGGETAEMPGMYSTSRGLGDVYKRQFQRFQPGAQDRCRQRTRLFRRDSRVRRAQARRRAPHPDENLREAGARRDS